MIYNESQVDLVNSHNATEAYLWELQFTSETVYLWNGLIDRKFNDNITWMGLRYLVVPPTISFPRDATNETTKFDLHGMEEDIELLMWDSKNEVFGNYLIQYKQLLAGNTSRRHQALTPVGPKILHMIYIMRGIESIEEAPGVDGEPRSYVLSIKVELITSARAQASYGRNSPADQAARFPGQTDKIFNDVANIARGQTVKLF